MKVTFITFIMVLFSICPLMAQDSTAIPNTQNDGVISKVEHWYQENMNYYTIAALMVIESSFIPFPSEVVIPPAAYVACIPNSHLNIYLVVVFGTLGALIGALINYFLAFWLGRIVIYKLADSKFGRLCMINSEKVDKAEKFFNENGNISTFIGRLIPGIRQLISIPAGLAKMRLLDFILYTTLGALVWNIILATVGYIAHGQQEIIHKFSHELSIILLLVGILFIAYLVIKTIRKAKRKSA